MATLQALQNFWKNEDDVYNLLRIHGKLVGTGVGYKHGVEVINRATIVFITAVWESFIEDLAMESFAILLKTAKKASDIPSRVRVRASEQLREDKDKRRIWDLADDGWRPVLGGYALNVLKDFHTPKTKQIDVLFECLLDLRGLSTCWRWNGMTPDHAGNKLDRFVTIRGNIAHRTRHDTKIYKKTCIDYQSHLHWLVGRSVGAVHDYVKRLTGEDPWPAAIGRGDT